MHYNESSIYTSLTPREKKFFDESFPALMEKKDEGVKELATLVKMNKFTHGKLMINLFESLDTEGNISPKTRAGGVKKEKVVKEQKLTFNPNAYRRWKRKGFVSASGTNEIVTLKGVKYLIKKDGSTINLSVSKEINEGKSVKTK